MKKASPGIDKLSFAKRLTLNCDGVILLNMSDLLEDALNNENETFKIDKTLKSQTLTSMKKHDLVSNELAFDTLFNAVRKYEKWNGAKACLVVGYPRTDEQAKDWELYVRKKIICI